MWKIIFLVCLPPLSQGKRKGFFLLFGDKWIRDAAPYLTSYTTKKFFHNISWSNLFILVKQNSLKLTGKGIKKIQIMDKEPRSIFCLLHRNEKNHFATPPPSGFCPLWSSSSQNILISVITSTASFFQPENYEKMYKARTICP